MLQLNIEQRDGARGADIVRKEGKIPAVFYGRKEESTPVAVDEGEFHRIWQQAGESTILSLEGVGEAKEALIHDVAVHPVSGKPLHADFYVIEKGKKLEVTVPFEFVGVAPAVKNLGATLIKVMHEVDVEVLPKDLPHEIAIDVSVLVDFESQITIKDLKLPDGVNVLAEPDEVIAAVAEPKEEEEEEPSEIDIDSIEVAGEKQPEETAEDASETTPQEE